MGQNQENREGDEQVQIYIHAKEAMKPSFRERHSKVPQQVGILLFIMAWPF